MKVGDLVTINHPAWAELDGMVGIILEIDIVYTQIYFSYLGRKICIGSQSSCNLEVVI